MTEAVVLLKESEKTEDFSFSFSKWRILRRKTAHSAVQNDSFWRAKKAVFECKMRRIAHFAG